MFGSHLEREALLSSSEKNEWLECKTGGWESGFHDNSDENEESQN